MTGEPVASDWLTPEDRAAITAQAGALREQARAGGLRFEAYLPPHLAEWVLGLVEQGSFTGPDEAAFVLLTQAMELEPHADLRRELLKRRIEASINDPRPPLDGEAVMAGLRAKLDAPRPTPAQWRKQEAHGD